MAAGCFCFQKETILVVIRTQCKKCGATLQLNFGNLSGEQAEEACRKLDTIPRECPGQHVELGGWWDLWNLEEALRQAYDGRGAPRGQRPSQLEAPTDKEYVEGLLAEGRNIFDGGLNAVPELGLPSLHSVPDLDHIGFGDFQNDTHTFIRCDSPRGARLYEKVVRQVSTVAHSEI